MIEESGYTVQEHGEHAAELQYPLCRRHIRHSAPLIIR
jgi:hypothetical protein